MLTLYDRYQQGSYQEVYNELLSIQEPIYHSNMYDDALLVMKEIMKRVRYNIELLFPRLITLNFALSKGSEREVASSERKSQLESAFPIFQPPTVETRRKIVELEQLTGSLPLSLKCFYEEVGTVNFVGLFPTQVRSDGVDLDPLFIFSLDTLLQQVKSLKLDEDGDLWSEDHILMLTGDKYFKYGYSGGGTYNIELPCEAVDAYFIGDPHDTTFINYLRICMKWGGFPGMENSACLSREDFLYLTENLLRF